MRRLGSVCLGAALLCVSARVSAEPQWSAGLLTGAAGVGSEGSLWQGTCWYNSLVVDALFGRTRNAEFGVGPYVKAATANFDDVRLSLGPSVLIPWNDSVPAVLSAGALFRRDDEAWREGFEAWLFIGSRSHNFHSSYGVTGGVSLGFQQELGDRPANAIILALRLDGLLMSLPIVGLASLVKGRPEPD